MVEEKKKGLTKRGYLVIFSLLLFIVVFPIIVFLFGALAYTQAKGGRIVDKETKKPLSEANLRVEWHSGYFFDVRGTLKKATYKTDEMGNFEISSFFKVLAIPVGLSDQEILVYAHGYKALRIVSEPSFLDLFEEEIEPEEAKKAVPKGLLKQGTLIELKPLKTGEEWAENFNFLQSALEEKMIYDERKGTATFQRNPDEDKFLKEEEKIYEKKFKKD